MQKLLILVKLSVYIFFLSVNGIATKNVFSNASGKFNFANDSVSFSAWLIPRAERSRRRQALRQTALISILLEQFNLLRYRYLKYSLGLGD